MGLGRCPPTFSSNATLFLDRNSGACDSIAGTPCGGMAPHSSSLAWPAGPGKDHRGQRDKLGPTHKTENSVSVPWHRTALCSPPSSAVCGCGGGSWSWLGWMHAMRQHGRQRRASGSFNARTSPKYMQHVVHLPVAGLDWIGSDELKTSSRRAAR